MAQELRTYGDSSIVRDVQAEIELLSPTENLFLNSLGKTTAKAMVHQYQTDTLRTAASAAANEYTEFTPLESSSATLVANVVERVEIAFSVTDAQNLVTHESGENEFARQSAKRMMDWSNAAEFDLVRGSLTSGASGTAPVMNGIIASISTNATSHTSGTVFSETILLGLLQTTYDNGNKFSTDVVCGAHIKRKISGFTMGITKNVEVAGRRAGAIVQLYESDFGTVNVHLHRYVQVSADATARVLGVNMDSLKVAYLREAQMVEYAKRASSRDAVIDGYLTLENRNEASCFYSDGFHKTS